MRFAAAIPKPVSSDVRKASENVSMSQSDWMPMPVPPNATTTISICSESQPCENSCEAIYTGFWCRGWRLRWRWSYRFWNSLALVVETGCFIVFAHYLVAFTGLLAILVSIAGVILTQVLICLYWYGIFLTLFLRYTTFLCCKSPPPAYDCIVTMFVPINNNDVIGRIIGILLCSFWDSRLFT